MNEIEINAKFNYLLEQRNNALNQCVNLSAEIAVLKDKIEKLESLFEEQEGIPNVLPD